MVTELLDSRTALRRDTTLCWAALLAALALGCSEPAPLAKSIGVGLRLQLSDAPGKTCGLGVGAAAPIEIGNPAPSATSRGKPLPAGKDDLNVTCSVLSSTGPFSVSIDLNDQGRGLRLFVEGTVPAGATGTAKVNFTSTPLARSNLYQPDCTLSAVAPFTVEPGEFWGQFTCPNATTTAATDINCGLDGIVEVTGCKGSS
jgi:hypothetical protein